MSNESNMRVFLESSAIAGIATRTMLHPIDTCKVRIQTAQGEVSGVCCRITLITYLQNVLKSMASIYRNEGLRSLYRGFLPAIAGTVPGVCLYFTAYKMSKAELEARFHWNSYMIDFTAGLLAEAVSCVVWVPTDVMKERAQASRVASTPYTFSSILRQEGLRGLYRGYGATLASFGPFSAFYFMFVEKFKSLRRSQTNRTDLSFYELLPICATAGGAAAFVTAPLDLIKVRMQVERRTRESPGFLPMMFRVLREGGIKALFRGGGSRVWFAVPNTAITMSIMESIQHRL